MKKLLTALSAMIVMVAVGPVFAQSIAGYTDSKGVAVTGDTLLSFSDVGKADKKFTMTLRNLYQYDNAGSRVATPGDPSWNGATVHVMPLGDAFGGTGALVERVKLEKAIGKGQVIGDSVTVSLDMGGYDCRPINALVVRQDGKRAWLGLPGFAKTNSHTGPYTMLVNGVKGPEGDSRYPFVGFCERDGRIVPPDVYKKGFKAEMARITQPPPPFVKDDM